jgi:uncharacterized membrane protein
MAKVKRTVHIDAPVEKVFSYWEDVRNHVAIWPSLVEVKDVQPLPNGGTSFRWVYKMAGMLMEGSGEITEYVANERLVEKSSGRGFPGSGFSCTMDFTFQPEDGGTKMIINIEYAVPIPVLGKMAEPLLLKLNEREADLILANLKNVLES